MTSRSCKSKLALLLSLIDLYGVMSFVVTRRTREIGIRLALVATGASAIRLVLRDAVVMIAVGMVIALPCVAALGKLIQSQLFGVTAPDPATVAAAALLLAAGALAAAFIPAWRASNVSLPDPLIHIIGSYSQDPALALVRRAVATFPTRVFHRKFAPKGFPQDLFRKAGNAWFGAPIHREICRPRRATCTPRVVGRPP